MKKIVIGILAHVDAGKTTLSEALLYRTGRIRKLGRVDHQDSFLDQDTQERERGITIFSKQAHFSLPGTEVELLDTPGHVDFSSEMERTLQVLDYAILVINGSDGVQSHTRTLWRLLKRYNVPTFIFVNKMDLKQKTKEELLENLQKDLSAGCIDLSEGRETAAEEIAMLDEALINDYLEKGSVSRDSVKELIAQRKLFPCYFGSALKLQGMEQFLEDLDELTMRKLYPHEFGAKVFKIGHDPSGERITYMKITGGKLRVRDVIKGGSGEETWENKINQIRAYAGGKYTAIDQAEAGDICAVTGLQNTYPSQGLGMELDSDEPLLDSFLTYEVIPEGNMDIHTIYGFMKRVEEEDPQLHVVWSERSSALHVQLMGEVQLEVLKRLMMDRFDAPITFGPGHIVYRETIMNKVEGVGHYEPLRHYSEVHLLMEPLERGAGIQIGSTLSTDKLGKAYQHLVLTHLSEKTFVGRLIGAPITDIRITLVGGAASIKHTVGGDFRQATYRAVRQGLMEARCMLLEPWYDFELTVPTGTCGRALSDLPQLSAVFEAPETDGNFSVIKGYAPVACLQGYALQVTSYTKGEGNLVCIPRGYAPCHNEDEIVNGSSYDPVADLENSPDSVFCAHGAGFPVPWYLVPSYMHLETEYSYLHTGKRVAVKRTSQDGDLFDDGDAVDEASAESEAIDKKLSKTVSKGYGGTTAEDKELMAIFERTYGKVKEKDFDRVKKAKKKPENVSKDTTTVSYDKTERKMHVDIAPEKRKEYLLVDGYNVIFSWESLSDLAKVSMDLARTKLMDLLSEYRSMHQATVILVFDAYNVPRDVEDIYEYHNIYVVYTKQAETADTYIEKTTYDMDKNYAVRVVTSDGAEQVIVLGHGALRVSSREFEDEVRQSHERFRVTMDRWNKQEKSTLTQTPLQKLSGEGAER